MYIFSYGYTQYDPMYAFNGYRIHAYLYIYIYIKVLDFPTYYGTGILCMHVLDSTALHFYRVSILYCV